MKILLISLICLSLSYAQGLDSLLDSYAQESELSKKTKDESAGNLIVYTRDDLERMQVESLKDILKSLRLFAYTENRMGHPDILNQDPINYYSSSIRVYLNETELVSGITGSGLILFGDMEMDFIDHVEIYQGFPSFDFGIEPATIVIRLYSKSSEHDEGGRVKATLSTNGAHKENAYYTNSEDGISYFLYANHTDNKKDSYNYENEILKRDTRTNRFYGSVATDNHTLDFHFMNTKGDALLGPLLGNIPDSTYKENQYINLSTNSKFLDNSLILNFSYAKIDSEYSAEYDPGKYTVLSSSIPTTSYRRSRDQEDFTTSLKKKWDLESHAVTLGAQYRYKNFDNSNRYVNGILNNDPQAYNTENIYALFIQDLITIDDNHLLSLSVMDQEFIRNGTVDNQNTLQLRLGYIYTNTEWVAKTFISSQEFATEPHMLMRNQNLKEVTYKSILQEVSHATPQTLSKIILGYGTSSNMIIPVLPSGVENSSIDVNLYTAVAEFTYFFSQKDKLELQANYWYIESPAPSLEGATEHISYVVRMLNSAADFDIFNELLIHTGYANVDNAYDYSLGVKYNVNRDFHINFKGENIFDNGLDAYFYTYPPTDQVIIPVVERRFTLGMEYLF